MRVKEKEPRLGVGKGKLLRLVKRDPRWGEEEGTSGSRNSVKRQDGEKRASHLHEAGKPHFGKLGGEGSR